MPFGPVDPDLDLPALEERALARWRERDVVAETARLRKGGEPWIFYEGPPTANGRPGLHHVWARAFKDLFPRFQTMRGHDVPRKGGWDCHGLPVELEVEKELGLHNKHEIEAYGIEAFNERCRDSVLRYVEDWSSLTSRSGVWIDTADAYWTLDNDYVESVWWLVRRLWDEGLLYEGHRVTPYCARCGTALSSHEMAQGYRDVVDPSIYVRFPLTGEVAGDGGTPAPDADLLVWTTTPWTLISNVAAAAGPTFTYVRVAAPGGGRDLVLGERAAARLFPDAPVLDRWTGADLAGWRYERPFDELEPVAGKDSVARRGGRLRHRRRRLGHRPPRPRLRRGGRPRRPRRGPARAQPGRRRRDVRPPHRPLERPLRQGRRPRDHRRPRRPRPAGRRAALPAQLPALLAVRHAPHLLGQDVVVRPHLRAARRPARPERHHRLVPRAHQERPVRQLARGQHRLGAVARPLLGHAAADLALRWRGSDTCVGSVAELSDLAGRDLSDLDLHRPFVDDVTWTCGRDGCHGTVRRLAPVLDAWFDSGSMPSAQPHHPFAGDGAFERSFPADFICEAIDQTRGWFYSLLAVNTLVFGETPYRNVVCLGHIVDEDGQKMSKSKGNVIDPWQIFSSFGADALRWYFFSAGQPWTPRRVFEDGIRESTRQTLLTLWNVYSFFVTYADLDGWSPGGRCSDRRRARCRPRARPVGARRARRHRRRGHRGARALRRPARRHPPGPVRRRPVQLVRPPQPAALLEGQRRPGPRHAAPGLVVTAQLLAPFCPFLADELYVTLTGEVVGPPVRLARRRPARPTPACRPRWPRPGGWWRSGRAARTDAKVKVRQPLPRALVLHPGADARRATCVAEVAASSTSRCSRTSTRCRACCRGRSCPTSGRSGPGSGPGSTRSRRRWPPPTAPRCRRRLEADGFIEVAGERLTADDVEVRATRHEAFALAEEGGWAVALDLELDDDLRREGLAREIVRSLNDLRKEIGLAVSDRITVTAWPPTGPVADAVTGHRDYVAGEVLAAELTVDAARRRRRGRTRAHRRRPPGRRSRSPAPELTRAA